MMGRSGLGWGLIAGMFVAGCESAPLAKPGSEKPTTSAPTTAPATQPAASQPATTQPAQVEPELPEYLTIVARSDPQERATAEARIEAGNRLVIQTRNVRRLRLDRDKVPLNLRRSIALELDTQGIEWLARSTAEEFERSVNGEWTAVKPEQTAKPRKP
jgi:hypothetical protein